MTCIQFLGARVYGWLHRCTQGEGGEGEGGTLYTTSRDFDKLDHKNAIKHINKGPPSRFFHNPKNPPKTNLKMTLHQLAVVKFSWGGYTFSGFHSFFINKFYKNYGEWVHFINLDLYFLLFSGIIYENYLIQAKPLI
jgi:hypothetical protein